MKKYIGYIPAVLFSLFYLVEGMQTHIMPIAYLWTALLWCSAFLLHKGFFWGGIFGLISAAFMIYCGVLPTGRPMIEITVGGADRVRRGAQHRL